MAVLVELAELAVLLVLADVGESVVIVSSFLPEFPLVTWLTIAPKPTAAAATTTAVVVVRPPAAAPVTVFPTVPGLFTGPVCVVEPVGALLVVVNCDRDPSAFSADIA